MEQHNDGNEKTDEEDEIVKMQRQIEASLMSPKTNLKLPKVKKKKSKMKPVGKAI